MNALPDISFRFFVPYIGKRVEISDESIQQIKHYFDKKLNDSLKYKYEMSDDYDSDVIQIKTAITGIETNTEGMNAREIIPFAAVIGLVRAATDTRNQEVTVILEMEISNRKTGKVEASLLRIGQGENINMIWDANFSLDHIKDLLDEWALLGATSFQKLVN